MDLEKYAHWITGGGATAVGGVLAWLARWYHGKLYDNMESRVREAVMQATIDLSRDLSEFGGRVSSLEAHMEDTKSAWEKMHEDIRDLPQRVVEAMRK